MDITLQLRSMGELAHKKIIKNKHKIKIKMEKKSVAMLTPDFC
jgi:hypothetical protein